METSNNQGSLLSVKDMSKRFYATQALDRVSFNLKEGEIHTLVGENGAGKSTLIKILGGVYQSDSGQIFINGKEISFQGPREAQEMGIVAIPQEMNLVPAATVAENVTLGDWPGRRLLGFIPIIDRYEMRKRASEILQRLNFSGDLNVPVNRLAFAERQLVAIARALSLKARILILDEPSASLERRETERLFAVILKLKTENVGIIYVSHRLNEIVELSDRCTVLRDGKVVGVCERKNINQEELIRLMTGRDLEELHRPHQIEFGAARFECEIQTKMPPSAEGLPPAHIGQESKLVVREGEILGLTGLLNSGTTGFLKRLFGAENEPVTITKEGKTLKLKTPSDAIKSGIGFVPGERKMSLVMGFSIRDNITLPNMKLLSKRWRLDNTAIDKLVKRLMEAIDIRPRNPDIPVRSLSGGNQQKVIFARWLAGRADTLLLDEPTHGIDVGAKTRIHRLMREFVEEKGVILMASSDMMEVVSISDRVLAMRKNFIVGSMSRDRERYSERYLHEMLRE